MGCRLMPRFMCICFVWFPGMLVDSTGQYIYVFFACSVTGSTAGLFIMLSFYWLDRRRDREKVKSSSAHQDPHSLKPSLKMTIDCEYSPVPLHSKNTRDKETDVWLSDQNNTCSAFHQTNSSLHFVVFTHPLFTGEQSNLHNVCYTM